MNIPSSRFGYKAREFVSRTRAQARKLIAGLAAVLVASVAQAQLVPLDYYRMGDGDSQATFNGAVVGRLLDSVGSATLTCSGGPSYLNNVASASAAAATGSIWSVGFSGGGNNCNAPTLTTANDNFGLEAWAYPSATADSTIAYNGDAGANGWGLVVRGGTFQALLGGVTWFGSAPATANTWAHLAIVRDSGTATFYVNGVAAGTTASAPNPPNGAFAIGAAPPAEVSGFLGYVDEVRVFTFAPGTFNTNDLLLNHSAVTNVNDAGPGSLRQAMSSATAGQTIDIFATGTVQLQQILPFINGALTINGPGVGSFTIDGASTYRAMFIDAPGAAVRISGLSFANGRAKGGHGGNAGFGGGGGLGAGGAIFVNRGDVTLARVAFAGNTAVGGDGGGDANNVQNSGGGGGLGGNGGTATNGASGGGGFLGNGGDSPDSGGGGGGGVFGNGGNGGNDFSFLKGAGGGGGAYTAGQDGGATIGGAGADGIGGKGGNSGGGGEHGGPGAEYGGGGGCGPADFVGTNGGGGGRFGGGGGACKSGPSGGGGGGGDFGGGGGSPGGSGVPAGPGGFGGGGGGSRSGPSGWGGFGGGSGGAGTNSLVGVPGPFAGRGANNIIGGGGGGAGLGGAIFLRDENADASLTLSDSDFDAGSVGGGTAGVGGCLCALGGTARGGSMFLYGGTTTLSVSQGTHTIAGSIGGWTGALPSLLKTGNGILVLSDTSTDLGPFSISAGELRVNGLLPSTTVDISSGSTLSGTGSVTGSVALQNGGSLSPGDPTNLAGSGTLDLGSLTWNGGGTIPFQLGAANSGAGNTDELLISGDLNKSGSGFQFQFTDGANGAPTCATLYTLIEVGGSNGFSASDFTYTYSGGASATFASGGVFSITGNNVQFLAPCNQTISFTSAAPGAIVGGPTYTVTAVGGGSGNAVTFTIDAAASSVCSISGSTVSFNGAGTCVIDANQLGNGSYNPAPQQQQSFAVGKDSQTITNFVATPASPTYSSGGTFTVSATQGASSSPLAFGSTSLSVCTVSGSTVSILSAGTCALTADQASDANYNAAAQVLLNVTIAKATQTITNFAATPASPTYSSSGTFTVSATQGASSSPLAFGSTSLSVCTVSGSTVSMLSAGTCALTADQSSDANYNAAPQVPLSVTIAKGSQTITNFAATPASPTYSSGGTFTVSATQGASSSPLAFASTSLSVCTVSGSTVSMLSAGTCALTADQASDANYNAAPQVPLIVTIAKGSQTITNFAATPASPPYSSGGTFTVSATQGASSSPLAFGSTSLSVCTASGSTVSILSAGTCTLTADQASDTNYNAAAQVLLNVTIAKATQTITNFASTTANPTFSSGGTFTLSATKGASSSLLAFSSTSLSVCTVSGSTVSMLSAGTCALTADQASDANYNAAAQVLLNVTIAKAMQTISFTSIAPTTATAGGTYVVTAQALSGLPVELTIDAAASSICSIDGSSSGSTVTFTGVGTCVIDANQSGDSNYIAASQSTQSFDVAPGTAAKLAFVQQPVDLHQGEIESVQVAIEDALGNRLSSDNAMSVSLAGPACGNPFTLATTTAVNGVATFNVRFYSLATIGLTASSANEASATSSSFNVTANTDLVFAAGMEACRP